MNIIKGIICFLLCIGRECSIIRKILSFCIKTAYYAMFALAVVVLYGDVLEDLYYKMMSKANPIKHKRKKITPECST